MTTPTSLATLRCDCGGAPFAVSPGTEPETAADLFTLSRGQPVRVFCLACWAARFGGPRAAQASAP